MNRQLWTVSIDRVPMAVVAASCRRDAWRIVAALTAHNDLPAKGGAADLDHCPSGQRAKLMRLARELGVADSFLACVRDRMFLTSLGGLGDDVSCAMAAGQAA